MITAQLATRYRVAIIGRMLSEGAENSSDQEIERTLHACVCGKRLIEVAKYLREAGALSIERKIS